MKKPDLKTLVRENIRDLVPYSSARDEYFGTGSALLDANENPFNSPYNRYPDPLQRELKKKISVLYRIPETSIFLGNGSDEAIDLLIRAFCDPRIDEIVTIDPSYGMYEVCARVNDVRIKKVPLRADFSINPDKLLAEVNEHSKLIFLCSPNNPTSNLLKDNDVLQIAHNFKGLVIVDEAYIDFSGTDGLIRKLPENPNLVLLRTFSKAWAMAGLRLGMAFADPGIIAVLNKIKYPYNINILTQKHVIECLRSEFDVKNWIRKIISQRNWLGSELQKIKTILKVFPSDSNFLLVKTINPVGMYNFLKDHGLIVRDRSKVTLCEGCLRITIGNKEENEKLLKLVMEFKS